MKKTDSLVMLDMLGLNIIDYFITDDKIEATHYLARHMNGRRSMRTERGYEFLCPFYYNLPAQDLVPKAIQHLEEGYKLLFSPSLDWKDSVAFGSVALTDEVNDRMEYVMGPGLCRELDTHPDRKSVLVKAGTVSPFVSIGSKGIQIATMLNSIYKAAKEHCLDHSPCVLEWSYYPYPCGKRQEQLIFWELRPYK